MSSPQAPQQLLREVQALPAAGILAACAASQGPSEKWLRLYLTRVLSSAPSLNLPPGACDALIEQAVEISAGDNPLQASLHAIDGYLSAAHFSTGQAVPLTAALLYADVINSTAYDSRSRETLMRFISALDLPPRVLYQAESELATLVQAVEANAKAEDGRNVESVEEDENESRRRKNMKWLKIGTASVVGGIALGLSGGLIAPALLPALGSVGLASVSGPLAALGGSGAYAVGGLFGAAGAGVGAAAMSSRTGDVEEFIFEPCTTLGDGDGRGVRYDTAKVTPSQRVHEVFVPLSKEAGDSAMGGLLVWELLTSQDNPMIVPGGVAFAVQFRSFADKEELATKEVCLLPEEKMDAGGLDKLGEGRKRRTTGAITVLGSGLYVLRFRLLPGSLPVKISYRVALVPPGRDPPVWVMEENEYQTPDRVMGDVRSLSVAILVPGLINASDRGQYPGMFADQFSSVAEAQSKFDIQSFALRWESHLLVELSDALRRLIGKMAVSAAAQNGAMLVAPALVGAVVLPVSIIGAIRTILGNIWAKTISRATECGYMLAAELASRSFGNRPVSLAGYSAGALVIFTCLQELARRKLVGIVHDVALLGAPCTADVRTWQEVRTVVSGRLVNAYNPNDWYLEVYHRGTNLGAVAGTRSIQDPSGGANVENICLTPDQVSNHMDYAKRCSQILLDIGFGDAERRRPWMQEAHESEVENKKDQVQKFDKAEVIHVEELTSGQADDVVLFKALARPRSNVRRRASEGKIVK